MRDRWTDGTDGPTVSNAGTVILAIMPPCKNT